MKIHKCQTCVRNCSFKESKINFAWSVIRASGGVGERSKLTLAFAIRQRNKIAPELIYKQMGHGGGGHPPVTGRERRLGRRNAFMLSIA